MFQDYDDEDLEEAIGKFESNVLVTKERMVRYLCTEDFVTNQWCEDYIVGHKQALNLARVGKLVYKERMGEDYVNQDEL